MATLWLLRVNGGNKRPASAKRREAVSTIDLGLSRPLTRTLLQQAFLRLRANSGDLTATCRFL